jgi:Flp pilus assembly protein TadG
MSITDERPPAFNDADDLEEIEAIDDESWLAATTPKGIRVRLPMAALLLALAAVLGIWGGATLEAGQSTPAAANGAASGFAAGARPGGAGGAAAGGGGVGGGGGGLTGTVASVQGSQLKLTTSTGSTVTVNLLPSTSVSRTAAAAPSDVTAGETITVRGQTASDGTTTAQAVAIVPAAGG